MFIELTDHLRCPSDHAEAFLVLLPDRLEGRRVVAGVLGCPVCGREVRVVDGIADFGGAGPADGATALTADAAKALLGLDGPGGFLVLVGAATALAQDLAPMFAGVHLVLVNPPAEAADTEAASVVRARRLPLKVASMRGVVVGGLAGRDPDTVTRALGAVLPGNRLVVEGPTPDTPGLEILAEAGGVWVGRKASRSATG